METPSSPLAIQQEEIRHHGAFFVTRDGERLGEMVYTRQDATHITVVHTEVSDKLRGMGVARKLLDALVAWARDTKTRVHATCPYAKAQFEKDASIQDVYER
ncbi:MAG TPA: GNAT family N-acetyltransferase [Polyangiales bacterium]|jgi:hypothetical protein|nr:GNAT family N-acetyltransferase [Polyangiales bacterium]